MGAKEKEKEGRGEKGGGGRANKREDRASGGGWEG